MGGLKQDTILAAKYRLVRLLGKGGMGSVWYAEHLALESPVAIKLIDPEISSNPEAVSRFLREAKAAAALRSPHVVQILDYGVDGDIPYIAMELLVGESLGTRLEGTGRLSPAEASRILTHISRAVGRAHDARIVHRDLKPENVFLIRNDEEEIAKVLDFGIAKLASPLASSASGGTRPGALLGTPMYMSPEQAEGLKSVDHRTDIWAMGVIAFECMVGRRPFEAETIGSLLLAICSRPLPIPSKWAHVPAGLDVWFARACARDPEERFPSAREAATELRRICEEATADWRLLAVESSDRLSSAGRSSSKRPPPAAQSVIGFSTTNVVNRLSIRRQPYQFLLGVVGLLLVGGVVFLWTRLQVTTGSPAHEAASTFATSASTESPAPSIESAMATSPAAPSASTNRPHHGVPVTELPRVPDPAGAAAAAPPPPLQAGTARVPARPTVTPPPKASTPDAAPPPSTRVNLGF